MNTAIGLSGLAPISFSPMRNAIRPSSMPKSSQTNWVALKVKIRRSRSGSFCVVRTSDTLCSDILTSSEQLAGEGCEFHLLDRAGVRHSTPARRIVDAGSAGLYPAAGEMHNRDQDE